jgi:hypothetical protein
MLEKAVRDNYYLALKAVLKANDKINNKTENKEEEITWKTKIKTLTLSLLKL